MFQNSFSAVDRTILGQPPSIISKVDYWKYVVEKF